MSVADLRVAVLGGIPASLGGGGLEVQIRETTAALTRLGLDAFPVAAAAQPRPFDVLHAFGAEPDVCHQLTHWRRNPTPLVVSPVLVVAPGAERRQRLLARVPSSSFGPAMRAALLRRADLVVAQTGHEEQLVRALGARATALVPNGVTPVAPGSPPDGTPTAPYVVLVGTVSTRKRQTETVRALAGERAVVAGGFEGTTAERDTFTAAVRDSGATWLGEIGDAAAVRGLLAGARALVHLSTAEGQALAILEALAVGTPVLCSALPANVELAGRYPGWVRCVEPTAPLAAELHALEASAAAAPAPVVPTWDDVAARLRDAYAELGR